MVDKWNSAIAHFINCILFLEFFETVNPKRCHIKPQYFLTKEAKVFILFKEKKTQILCKSKHVDEEVSREPTERQSDGKVVTVKGSQSSELAVCLQPRIIHLLAT